MPASLIKSVVSGSATVSLTQARNLYTATVTAGMVSGGTTTIPDTSFVDDNGTAVSAGGLPTAGSGVFDVYVNGVVQQSGLSTISSTQLVINAALGTGVPVSLKRVTTSGSSTVTITT